MTFKRWMLLCALVSTVFCTAGAAKGCGQSEPKPRTTVCVDTGQEREVRC